MNETKQKKQDLEFEINEVFKVDGRQDILDGATPIGSIAPQNPGTAKD